MRVSEGTCSYCGAYVYWDDRQQRYVNAKDKTIACHPAEPTPSRRTEP